MPRGSRAAPGGRFFDNTGVRCSVVLFVTLRAQCVSQRMRVFRHFVVHRWHDRRFFLGGDIRKRLDASAPHGKETRKAVKERLCRTAFATSPTVVRAALRGMKERAAAVCRAGGADIDERD